MKPEAPWASHKMRGRQGSRAPTAIASLPIHKIEIAAQSTTNLLDTPGGSQALLIPEDTEIARQQSERHFLDRSQQFPLDDARFRISHLFLMQAAIRRKLGSVCGLSVVRPPSGSPRRGSSLSSAVLMIR